MRGLMALAAECPAGLGWPDAVAIVGACLAAALIFWVLAKYLM